MAQCSHSDRVLYIGNKGGAPFSADSYLHNLNALAEQGNWLSQVLVALVAKLNLYESACRQLKHYGDGVPQPGEWALQQANLSVGGIAIHTPDSYEVSESVVLFLQIESHPQVVEARVVNVLRLEDDDPHGASTPSTVSKDKAPQYRVAFEFEHLGADQLALITRFVTAQELAMAHPPAV
nr:PilZ domain-containing protein [Thiomicrorhabdus cannonii]